MIQNSELIEWLKKKAETVTMPGARKMYQAAVKALEAQKDMISRQVANVAICNACGKIDCDKMDKCDKLQLPPANNSEFPNSSDTISRANAIEALYSQREKSGNIWVRTAITNCVEAIEQLPPAQPKIGRWIGKYPVTSVCSECGFLIHDSKVKAFAYCPNCGAEMREVADGNHN